MSSHHIESRFGGIRRLYGVTGMDIISSMHVCVVGVGGVGSWAVEALARSGIGEITLIDHDDICETNTNRQLHTLPLKFEFNWEKNSSVLILVLSEFSP